MSIFDPSHFELPKLPSAADMIFKSAADNSNSATLNYGHDKWLIYALGYKEAADRLIAVIERERGHLDLLVYPIVFLYRHYLELAIKGLIRQAQTVLGDPTDVAAKHNIVQLWADCSALLSRVSPGDSVEERNQIGRLLGELEAVDPVSTAFRYPEDTRGRQSLPDLRQIDLSNVRDVVAKISVILDGAAAQMDQYVSAFEW